jgi:hypothetical protein
LGKQGVDSHADANELLGCRDCGLQSALFSALDHSLLGNFQIQESRATAMRVKWTANFFSAPYKGVFRQSAPLPFGAELA